jgi:hypothetical protein
MSKTLVNVFSLHSFTAAARSGSPAHVAKVSKLSAAVSAGQYQADAYAVSGSIIQHSIEFGAANYLTVHT